MITKTCILLCILDGQGIHSFVFGGVIASPLKAAATFVHCLYIRSKNCTSLVRLPSNVCLYPQGLRCLWMYLPRQKVSSHQSKVTLYRFGECILCMFSRERNSQASDLKRQCSSKLTAQLQLAAVLYLSTGISLLEKVFNDLNSAQGQLSSLETKTCLCCRAWF